MRSRAFVKMKVLQLYGVGNLSKLESQSLYEAGHL